MIYTTSYKSPIGDIILAGNGDGLAGLWMAGQKYFFGTIKEERIEKEDLNIFKMTQGWLDRYFSGDKPTPDELKLVPRGSEFRQHVFKILCGIPWGQVTTYGEIAKKMAKAMHKKTMSPQAVGGAVSHNPISIIIPCHRVVGADGNLTGYAGGIDRKIKLLELENVNMEHLYIPCRGTAL